MITSRKCRKTRNKVLMCNFHPDFTVFRARVAYRTNNQKEFTIIPFRCTGYDGQHFVKDIEIEDKTATSVDVAYILTVSLSGENKLFKDTSNLEVLKESEEYITVSLDKKRCSKTDVKNTSKRKKRLSPEEEEAQVREVENILRSDPEVYNQIASSSLIKTESKHCENEAKNKTLATISAIKQICFDYMCEAQSTSKKQDLANALTCYTKIKELIKTNSRAISESSEISKIKNLIQNIQSICMKLASEIHDEESKTSENESNDKKTSENVETSQNESNNKKTLNESNASIESEDFAVFRQNYTAFGFP